MPAPYANTIAFKGQIGGKALERILQHASLRNPTSRPTQNVSVPRRLKHGASRRRRRRHRQRSDAIQGNAGRPRSLDCFVAPLLAMTIPPECAMLWRLSHRSPEAHARSEIRPGFAV